MGVKDGGLGLVDFRRRLKVLRGWWGKRMLELDNGEWCGLAIDNWRIRFCPRGVDGEDLRSLLGVGTVNRLRFKGFWWGIVEA